MEEKNQFFNKIIYFGEKPAFYEYDFEVALEYGDINVKKLRYYLPIDYTKLPIIEISSELLSHYGYSIKNIQETKNLATLSLVIKTFVNLKSGKNKFNKRAYRILNPNQILYNQEFNTDLLRYENKKKQRKIIKELSAKSKTYKYYKILHEIKKGILDDNEKALFELLDEAIYINVAECIHSDEFYQKFKTDKLSKLADLTNNFTIDIEGDNRTEFLKKVKINLVDDIIDRIQSDELNKIVDEAIGILNKFESISNVQHETETILIKLKAFLHSLHKKKYRGLKVKLSSWHNQVENYLKEKQNNSRSVVVWIIDTFSPTLPLYQKLVKECDQKYYLIFRLFMKECLRQISYHEKLNKYEKRLFTLFYLSTKGMKYYIPMFEPFFLNYYNYSPYTQILILYCSVFRIRDINDFPIVELAYNEFLFFLKFFPIWIGTVRDEEKRTKRTKREKSKTKESIEVDKLPTFSGNSVEQDEEKKILYDLIDQYCTSIQKEILKSYFFENKSLSQIGFEKNVSRQYIFKVKKEALTLLREKFPSK